MNKQQTEGNYKICTILLGNKFWLHMFHAFAILLLQRLNDWYTLGYLLVCIRLAICRHLQTYICLSTYLTSRIDFLLQCSLMTLMAHSRSCSPRGTFTLSCLSRPTWNSWWSSRRVLGVRTRSVDASRLPCNQAIALQRKSIIET